MRTVDVRRLGLREYRATVELQEDLVRRRRAGEVGDTLLLLEHEPVITLGRSKDTASSAYDGAIGVPIVETSRGGQATYHGPGQLVMYPILDLRQWQCDLHAYLRQLEDVVILTLSNLGLEGHRVAGYTGVWVGEKKIASIGVAVRGWITYHGVALNVANDMRGFSVISPCGLPAEIMTRVTDHRPQVTLAEVLPLAERAFRETFGY